ncbi:MAG: GAF domain-containing protein, partial [Bacteroidota bacterium]|nr:GAF domain-containing protein [Bacteroidota bacterium]
MEKLRRLKLNARMVFYILSASIVLFTLTIVYNAYKTRQIAKENAKTLIQSKTKEYSYNISKIFESAIEQADAINASIIGMKQNGNCDRQAVNYTIKNILKKNAEFIGVWTCWEPNKFDCKDSLYSNKDGYDRTGRLIEYVNRNSGGENNIDNIKNNIISGANDYYSISKNNDEEVLTEPYGLYRGENKIYVVSVLVPIHDNGIVVGVTGIDIDLKKLEEINSEIKLFNNGFGKIISNKGIVVAHPQKENIGLPTVEIKDGNHEVSESIKNGKDYTNILYSYTNKVYSYKSFTPIKAGNIKSPWSYCIQVPLNEILAESDSGIKSSLLVGIIGLILLGIIIYLLSKRIANPIIRTTNALKLVSEGILNEENKVDISTNDELNEMGNAVNRLVDGLREKAEFARKIGEGELEAEYKAASEKDVLGNSLIEMRKSLLEAAAAEKIRKSEDTKRNWATNGLAQIGEILRKTEADDNTLYFNITSYIVKYLDCNQGGLFIINNENEKDEHLELVAMYAFNKKKYISKRVEIGEGLLGTCVLEKDTIYMTEVPDNYIEITSGLGKANPRSILIVPLKLNDSVHGVLELASFKEIEKYQIEFVEKLAESIASTISNVKINIRTKLLLEQSQRQTEQLKSQEEEMRQNLEELTATQ